MCFVVKKLLLISGLTGLSLLSWRHAVQTSLSIGSVFYSQRFVLLDILFDKRRSVLSLQFGVVIPSSGYGRSNP